MKIVDDSIVQADNQNLACAIKQHVKDHGWYNTAKVLREVVFVHVGWDSKFTELDNVLRKIEREFKETKPYIPNLPDGDPSDHFS